MEVLCSAQIPIRSCCSSSRVIASKEAKGSSMNKICGLVISARAIATRLCCPPDSSVGLPWNLCASPMRCSNSLAFWRSEASILLCNAIGSNTLSKTSNHSRSVGRWNTNPISLCGVINGWLFHTTSPCWAESRPAANLSKLVFPQPLRPSRQWNSPGAKSRLMFCSVSTPSK